MNARMPELKRAFEAAGFANVKTLLSSGNVVFDARTTSESTLERQAEAAMQAGLGRSFDTIVRSQAVLRALVEQDPFSAHALPAGAKKVVTFLRKEAGAKAPLPVASDGAQILASVGREVFTAYERSEKGPVFMALLEKTFGRELTTRTWETVRKCVVA